MTLWAVGRYDLGLSTEEFWALTPREFHALMKRHEISEEWLNYRTALLCAILAEIYRDPKKRGAHFTPEDFMPKKAKRAQTPEEMLKVAKTITKIMGKSKDSGNARDRQSVRKDRR